MPAIFDPVVFDTDVFQGTLGAGDNKKTSLSHSVKQVADNSLTIKQVTDTTKSLKGQGL